MHGTQYATKRSILCRGAFCGPTTHTYFLDFSMQFKQKTCNIQFIKSFHLKYGIYKPREVVNPIKKLVRKRTRFFI